MTDACVEDAEFEKYVNDRVDLYHAHVTASKESTVVETVAAVPVVTKAAKVAAKRSPRTIWKIFCMSLTSFSIAAATASSLGGVHACLMHLHHVMSDQIRSGCTPSSHTRSSDEGPSKAEFIICKHVLTSLATPIKSSCHMNACLVSRDRPDSASSQLGVGCTFLHVSHACIQQM